MTDETTNASLGQDGQDAAAYLRRELDYHIASFSRRRRQNRNRAFATKMLATVFSAVTTILVGLHGNALISVDTYNYLSAGAIVTSASVAIFTTWEAFFDHRWLWITYTSTLNTLYEIMGDLDYIQSRNGIVTKDETDRLYLSLKVALEQSNMQWSHKRLTETAPASASSSEN